MTSKDGADIMVGNFCSAGTRESRMNDAVVGFATGEYTLP